jgi:hypothetical protein
MFSETEGMSGMIPVGATAAADTTTTTNVDRQPRRVVLSNEEKLRIIAEKEARPHLTQPQLMRWCTEHFGKTPSQPMISKVMKQGRDSFLLPTELR